MDIVIKRATTADYAAIVSIGRIAVEEAHRDSSPAADLNDYMTKNYNDIAIQAELNNPENIYHLLYYKTRPIGFSKIILNVEHPNIQLKNITKLDRIYIQKEFFGLKLGYELLKFNVAFTKEHHQSGMWLFTWIGNQRAIDFYIKTGFEIIGTHNFQVSKTHSNPNHHMLLWY
jgi:ribosomal protein S18 acetylase RimI-like enzyme